MSSSRKMSTYGSQMLHDLIFARGTLPSMSLIICRSLPSTEVSVSEWDCYEREKVAPGSRTRIAFVMTWSIVVRWKKGPAPMVMPFTRETTERSPFVARTANCAGHQSQLSDAQRQHIRERNQETGSHPC